ncbi:DNA methyltransferase [Nanoarchaeota archaeon]
MKKVIEMGARGKYDTRNKLNELTNKEWIKFTKSWFIHNPPPRRKNEILHPAKFPETMITEFVEFFTKSKEVVLDPFLGTGSTLVACDNCSRKGIGMELMKKYADVAKERVSKKQKVITGNCQDINQIWGKKKLPKIDFIITSPPYGPMLNKKIGLIQEKRREEKLDTTYSSEDSDLGNVKDYQEFVDKLVNVFVKIKPMLNKDKYIVVILQNYTDGGEWRPLAWDFGKAMSKHFRLKGERIWCQNNKTLYPYGYRWSWVTNVHHHYCLIFKNELD